MKIAICEDEEIMAKKIWNMLFDMPDMEAKYFLSATDLLKCCENGETFDIFFCDIVMDAMDGIALCREIKKIHKDAYIVILSNYIEFAPQGYEVGAFRYLLKPVTREALEKVIWEIREDMKKTSKILLKAVEGNIILKEQDILYAEIRDKETCIYYDGDSVTINKSLGELEASLNPHAFFRVHRKYLVNLERVREFDQSLLTLDNGKSLPVSRRQSAGFKKALYHFLGKI
ncbi:MAG: LytR/AlgR family response regulator transcription factor [Lachnospiraceae bacterium]